jgi:glutamate/tyrosine decarboxylase-like PLP-dependent enzyme
MHELLSATAGRVARYLQTAQTRRVSPTVETVRRLDAFDGPLPDSPTDPAEILAQLDELGSPATVTTSAGRYFGFVIGGTLPAALAANWLAGAWDQNAAMYVMSPIAAKLEEVVQRWTVDLLGLPPLAAAGFVTGTTMANFSGLAAARTALLVRRGWNVEEQGLFHAPEIRVIVGAEVHASLQKALAMLGFGRARVTTVPADGQGRMCADLLPGLDDHTIVCIQAGNVNTGDFDPARAICEKARAAGAWVHVDGAFGLWAGASPALKHLIDGVELADSWAIDCHKWLNVPYDSGLVVVRQPEHLRRAMSLFAAYLPPSASRDNSYYTPESSRRARGVELWAAMRSLGKSGLAEIIERNCRQARRFAELIQSANIPNVKILNEVVLNQVLVSFGTAEETQRIILAVQTDGTCWCGPTVWHSQTAMRISVSNWQTTDEDIVRSAEAIICVAKEIKSQRLNEGGTMFR